MAGFVDTPARKSRLVDLHDRQPLDAAQAFGRIATECIDQWRTNEELLLVSRAMPHLHQMRVGIRRLRSSCSLLRRSVPALTTGRDVIARLREGALPFGRARDLDVLLGSSITEALSHDQLGRLRAEREGAYDVTLTILSSPLWRSVTEEVQRLVADVAGSATPTPPVSTAAGAALERRWRTVVAEGADLAALSPEHRHEIRIEAKKLRYGFEFFHSLYAASSPTRETSAGGAVTGALACAGIVEDLQSALGVLNDHASAERLFYSVGAHAPEVDVPGLIEAAQTAQRAVADMPVIWST